MNPETATTIEALGRELDRYARVAVAVSGGIDSLTLATLAARRLGDRAEMFHSLTDSVPSEATQRTRDLAARLGWQLHVIDANEFARDEYLSNPVNRCFYCKQSLYAEIGRHTTAQVLSGANKDDLGEYRPGLDAARDAGARHPFVDAGVDKKTIRAIAREVGLGDLSEIPASPCLSSRVETGIRITAPMLQRIEDAETAIRRRITAASVRCRVRASGVVIEIDAPSLAALTPAERDDIATAVARIFDGSFPTFAPYRVGSAFLIRSPSALGDEACPGNPLAGGRGEGP
jgi:pyridinium-3,5-biscarboxylic acid mononucleotide sulfurtransferase